MTKEECTCQKPKTITRTISQDVSPIYILEDSKPTAYVRGKANILVMIDEMNFFVDNMMMSLGIMLPKLSFSQTKPEGYHELSKNPSLKR